MVKRKGEHWVKYSEIPAEDMGGGLVRRVGAYNDDVMAVTNTFEKGAIGALHSHPHAQVTYIVSGKFEFTIGEEKRVVEAGDSMVKEGGLIHGCVCLEAGSLIDFFAPMRQDFVAVE